MKRTSIFLLALACAAPAVAQRYPAYAEGYRAVVTCESVKKRLAYCEADTRDGVRLLEQFSKAACVEGRTWGTDQRGLWVSNPCQAEFIRQPLYDQSRNDGYRQDAYSVEPYRYQND
jgi:hypothetical protein